MKMQEVARQGLLFPIPCGFSLNFWEVNSCALPDSRLQMRLHWGWWLCPLQAALLLGGSLEMAPDNLVLTPSLPPCAFALLCAPSISYWRTRSHTQRVSTHTPLCFSFFFGFLSLYCFKLVAGLVASLKFHLPLFSSSSSCVAPLLLSLSVPRSDTVYFLCCFPNAFVGTARDIITSCGELSETRTYSSVPPG